MKNCSDHWSAWGVGSGLPVGSQVTGLGRINTGQTYVGAGVNGENIFYSADIPSSEKERKMLRDKAAKEQRDKDKAQQRKMKLQRGNSPREIKLEFSPVGLISCPACLGTFIATDNNVQHKGSKEQAVQHKFLQYFQVLDGLGPDPATSKRFSHPQQTYEESVAEGAHMGGEKTGAIQKRLGKLVRLRLAPLDFKAASVAKTRVALRCGHIFCAVCISKVKFCKLLAQYKH